MSATPKIIRAPKGICVSDMSRVLTALGEQEMLVDSATGWMILPYETRADYGRGEVLAELSAETDLTFEVIESVLDAIDKSGIKPADWTRRP